MARAEEAEMTEVPGIKDPAEDNIPQNGPEDTPFTKVIRNMPE